MRGAGGGVGARVVVAVTMATVGGGCAGDCNPSQDEVAHLGATGDAGARPVGRAFHVRSLARDLPKDDAEAARVQLGARIFADTPGSAGKFVGNALSCKSCHLEGGQKEGALPLVAAEAMYPAFQKRAGRAMTIEERIQGCFERSENGSAPPAGSDVLTALTAYVRWLSDGEPRGAEPPWRGGNRLGESRRVAIGEIDVKAGERLYGERCASCHGVDGRGGAQAMDAGGADTVVPPPVWGPRSFNDGAGAGRVYTLAGFIRWAMPLGASGTLNDVEAQEIAAYVDSKERPVFAGKSGDFAEAGVPVDAVYYRGRRAGP